jgi:death-on-curing protein
MVVTGSFMIALLGVVGKKAVRRDRGCGPWKAYLRIAGSGSPYKVRRAARRKVIGGVVAGAPECSYGHELYPGIHLKMAATLDSVNRNDPLVDGNKRLAWIVVAATYRVNGYPRLAGTVEEHEALVLKVASDHPELDWIANQLESMFDRVTETD